MQKVHVALAANEVNLNIVDLFFLVLATRILYLLGREGPRTPQPSKYIRFIYNRVILENAAVRAGTYNPSFTKRVRSEKMAPGSFF